TSTCGVEGFGTGMQASVINWVAYEIRDMTSNPGSYAPVFASPAPDDAGRKELVRLELDADGNEMNGTVELVAEDAVDLRFALTVVSGFPKAGEPTLKTLDMGDTTIYDNYAFDVSKSPGLPGPERIRSLRTKLTVRSRAGDRQENIPASPSNTIYRY